MQTVRAKRTRSWHGLLLLPWLLAPACVFITNADRYEIGDDNAEGGQGGTGGTDTGGAGGSSGEAGTAGAGGAFDTFPTTTIHFDDPELATGDWTTRVETTEASREALDRQSYPNDPWWPADQELTVRNHCTTRVHEVTSNPAALPLDGLDDTLVWPGALMLGRAYATGTLQALPIQGPERTPLGLTISYVSGQSEKQVTRLLLEPSTAAYQELLGEILETEFEDELRSLGEIEVRISESKQPSRFWQEQGLATRFSNLDDALADAIDPESTDRTLIVQLVQRLFDVTVQGPPVPEAWVSADYLENGLRDALESGAISDESPPVYVSKVSYGRMLTLAISSSTARGPELAAAVNASIRALRNGEKPERSDELDATRDQSRVATAPLGGDRKVVGALEESWDWASFFADGTRLSNAVPFRAELRNLADNSPAGLTEHETYEETVCFPTLVEDGPFDFGFDDAHSRPSDIGSIDVTAKGDFNGDGTDDVVWNHLSDDENAFYVGYSGGSFLQIAGPAGLCAGERCDFSDAGVPWSRYQLLTGDFDGDGLDDLLWVPRNDALGELGYDVFLLRATSRGFQRAPLEQQFASEDPYDAYRAPLVKDMDGNGAMDLVFSFVRRDGDVTIQEYEILLATKDDVPFSATPFSMGTENTDLSYPNTELTFDAVDVNGDGHLDLLWGLLGQQLGPSDGSDKLNVTQFKLNLPDEDSLSFGDTKGFQHLSEDGWNSYTALYGDFDGDSVADAAFLRLADSADTAAIHWARSEGVVMDDDPQFLPSKAHALSGYGYEDWAAAGDSVLFGQQRHLGTVDLNGDGADDIVLTSLSADYFLNQIRVLLGGLGAPPFFFDFEIPPQNHPIQQDWDEFETWLVGDFDGDGKGDLLWNDASQQSRVFIAYGKEGLYP